jgi:hypothetical protein
MFDKGEKIILMEQNGVVLAQWGKEYVTWVRDVHDGFAWGHYYPWFAWCKEQAYEYALDDYRKRLGQYCSR